MLIKKSKFEMPKLVVKVNLDDKIVLVDELLHHSVVHIY